MCDEYEYTSEDVERELTTYMELIVDAAPKNVEQIRILTQATNFEYDAELKALGDEHLKITLKIHDFLKLLKKETKKYNGVYAYGREDRDTNLMENKLTLIGQSYAELEKKGRIYIDKQGNSSKLEELLEDIPRGAMLVVGTITDFMTPDIEEMRMTLAALEDKDIALVSMLEYDYDFDAYYYKIGLADNIARVRMGLKPELK